MGIFAGAGNLFFRRPVASTAFTYQTGGRLNTIAHAATASGASFSQTQSYSYDGLDRLAGMSAGAGDYANYTYDLNNQLTAESHPGSNNRTYAYDAAGNRLSVNSTGYETGDFNRLLSDGVYAYQYDDEGNVTYRYKDNDDSGTRNSGDTDITEYSWDWRNRLTQVLHRATHGGSADSTVSYAYDAFNQMTGRTETVGSTTTRTTFAYRDGQVVLQFDKTGSSAPGASDLSHRFLWAAAVDQLMADEQVHSLTSAASNDILWALADNQGSVRDMVDSAGKRRLHREFDAFGNVIDETHYNASGTAVTSGQTGYLDEAFAFTGRWFDKATGLQNNLNRWYNPKTGRWMSEDPIGFAAGDANLYRYVGNSPTRRTDPSGLADGPAPVGPPVSPPPVDFDGGMDSSPPWGDGPAGGGSSEAREFFNECLKKIADEWKDEAIDWVDDQLPGDFNLHELPGLGGGTMGPQLPPGNGIRCSIKVRPQYDLQNPTQYGFGLHFQLER